MNGLPRVAVVQDGARGHYGVPVALQRAGLLDRVYTDWFVREGSLRDRLINILAGMGIGAAKRMRDRRCKELDATKVVQSFFHMLRLHRGGRHLSNAQDYWQWQSKTIGDWVLQRGLGSADSVFGFVRHIHPDLCRACRQKGLVVVADQMIAPALVELRETRLQMSRFPGWQDNLSLGDLDRCADFERRTWEAVDHITCPSQYVKDCMTELGVQDSRVTVVNYPIDEEAFSFHDRRGRGGPVTIGFVGQVGLRKGVQYILEVARRFDPARVRFVLVGDIAINAEKAAAHRGPVEMVGAVPRSEVPQWVRKFDIMFFPSTCEGSAYALMEAMASGLPIVASPNSGTIARHGVEGLLAPYDDVDANAAHLESLVADPERRWHMGEAARRHYEECNLENYSRCLAQLFCRLRASRP